MLNALAIDKKYLLTKMETLNKANIQSIQSNELTTLIENITNLSILSVENGVAYIDIYGELVVQKDWIAELFGFKQVTYTDILKSLAIAEADNSISKVQLNISSPGGSVSGVMEVMNAIANFKKPIVSVVDMCCSAAYFIASQTNKITAINKLSMIGSVGVIFSFLDDTEQMKMLGLEEIIITSTDAPNKYKDPATPKGAEVIQQQLDAIHNVLIKEVSNSRNISVEKINSDFGKGGILLSEKAVEVGMIDDIKIITNLIPPVDAEDVNTCDKNKILKNIQGGKIMDMKELQAQHPEVYTAVFNMGKKAETERIEKLNGWAKHNPETSEIVAKAITQGNSVEDILPELLAAVKTGQAPLATAAAESPKAIAQAAADSHMQPEPITPEPSAEEKIDVDALAKDAFKSIFK
jgi:ClpP class serine protease